MAIKAVNVVCSDLGLMKSITFKISNNDAIVQDSGSDKVFSCVCKEGAIGDVIYKALIDYKLSTLIASNPTAMDDITLPE